MYCGPSNKKIIIILNLFYILEVYLKYLKGKHHLQKVIYKYILKKLLLWLKLHYKYLIAILKQILFSKHDIKVLVKYIQKLQLHNSLKNKRN